MTLRGVVQIALLGAIAALLFWFGHTTPGWILAGMAGCFLLLGLFAPSVHETLLDLVDRLARAVGNVLGIILLSSVYFTLFVLGACWLRITRIDPLNRKFPGDGETNWIDRAHYGAGPIAYTKQYSQPHGQRGGKAGAR